MHNKCVTLIVVIYYMSHPACLEINLLSVKIETEKLIITL